MLFSVIRASRATKRLRSSPRKCMHLSRHEQWLLAYQTRLQFQNQKQLFGADEFGIVSRWCGLGSAYWRSTGYETFAFVDCVWRRGASDVLGFRSGCAAARAVEDDYGN